MSMPLDVERHKNRVVSPFMQRLLPDNAQALSSIASTYSVSAAIPFAMLEHVGKDVAGALQLVESGQPALDSIDTRARVTRLSESDIASQLEETIAEYRDGIPLKRVDRRFSLAGAQPKIALHQFDDGAWGKPEGATPTTHILKPNGGSMTDERANGRWRRLHQEDLCQALAVSPAKKYQRAEGGPGLADLGKLTEAFPLLSDRRAVALDFYQAFVFNVVAGCTDAHAKNYSLLLRGETVQLAPLYDLATYAPYRTDGEVVLLPMNVNGKYQADSISSADLERAGARLRILKDEAIEIVRKTRTGMVTAFEQSRDAIVVSNPAAAVTANAVLESVRKLPLYLAAS